MQRPLVLLSLLIKLPGCLHEFYSAGFIHITESPTSKRCGWIKFLHPQYLTLGIILSYVLLDIQPCLSQEDRALDFGHLVGVSCV